METRTDFEAAFLAHYGRVLGLMTRIVGAGPEAEELTGEVFWKLYRQPPEARAWSNIGAWLYRTATNLGIDALRAKARRKRHESEAAETKRDAQEANGPLDDLLRAEKCDRVRIVLASLKPAQAQILLMRASGSSYKELADALETTVGSIGSLLNRAEAEFRKRYLRLIGGKEEI
ncbi:MAG: sigma-70 family RNA polymerase sigma factor [Acidobacteriales bacterium]|nr:sigma-70 family RNA polymerase sigma factor [Terriglobales bacterium]